MAVGNDDDDDDAMAAGNDSDGDAITAGDDDTIRIDDAIQIRLKSNGWR